MASFENLLVVSYNNRIFGEFFLDWFQDFSDFFAVDVGGFLFLLSSLDSWDHFFLFRLEITYFSADWGLHVNLNAVFFYQNWRSFLPAWIDDVRVFFGWWLFEFRNLHFKAFYHCLDLALNTRDFVLDLLVSLLLCFEESKLGLLMGLVDHL